MAVREVKISIGTYLLYSFCSILFFYYLDVDDIAQTTYKVSGLLFLVLISSRLPDSDIVLRSALLGFVFGFGLTLSFQLRYPWPGLQQLGCYLTALAFFHFSEYIMTALYNYDKLTTDSFLINHSREYCVAAVASWLEFALELYLVPALKTRLRVVYVIGLVLVTCGEALRKVAMVTAKANFTHVVQYKKRDEHVLVTWGVYRWFRHPSYVGWFYWSVGTQLILCNPLCCIAYAAASWLFFNERIREEEEALIDFFGKDYIDYQHVVGTGLPFIRGFQTD